MRKIFPSFFSLAFTFSFVAPDAQAAPPPRVEPAIMECSAPRNIGKSGDWRHQIADFGGVQRIYLSRINSQGSLNSFEINPGRDGIFGTRDDLERSVSGIVATVFEDSALIESRGPEYLLKPGPDNLLFTNDDVQIAPTDAMAMNKNGDLLAWFDMATNEIKACDLTIATGRGSCDRNFNHLVTTECVNGRQCLEQVGRHAHFLFPTKQFINGQPVPMILAFYSPPPGGVSLEPRVTMMDSGVNFPVLNLQSWLVNTHSFEIRGDLLIGNTWDVNRTHHMSVFNINYNSPNFMIRQQLIRVGPIARQDDGWFYLDHKTDNGSVLMPYLRNDDVYGRIYRDEQRDITAKFVSVKGSHFDAMLVRGKLVVGIFNGTAAAVVDCP
jgi:hypothetical protein